MYIITGGAGFIGSALIWKLNSLGISNIWVVDNLGTSDKWKNLVNRQYRNYVHRDDFLRMITSGADNFSREIDGIVHLGACSSTTERNADFLIRNNTKYSIELCKFAIRRGIRFINASSASTYGDGGLGFTTDVATTRKLTPLNIYGYSKHLFDLWLLDNHYLDKVASLKFFNVFGPNEYHKDDMRSMVCKAFYEIGKSGRLQLFKSCNSAYADGEQKRDFIYVKDCVEYIWFFLAHPEICGLFNIGTGTPHSWNELANAIFKALNLPAAVEFVDMPPSLQGKYQYYTCANMDWLKSHKMEFAPMTLEESVNDYIKNYLSRGEACLERVGEAGA